MKPAKALALIVPAGLLLGVAAGAVNRPVMIQHAKDYWPQSVREAQAAVDPYRPIYHGGPEDLTPVGYSYRPDLDYEALAFPDQAEVHYGFAEAAYDPEEAALAAIQQSTAERAATRAQAAVDDAIAAAEVEATEPATPQVAQAPASNVPAPVAPIVTDAF